MSFNPSILRQLLKEDFNNSGTPEGFTSLISSYCNISLYGDPSNEFIIQKAGEGELKTITYIIGNKPVFLRMCYKGSSIFCVDIIYGTNTKPTFTIYKDALTIEQFAYAISEFLITGDTQLFVPTIQESVVTINKDVLNEYRVKGALGKNNPNYVPPKATSKIPEKRPVGRPRINPEPIPTPARRGRPPLNKPVENKIKVRVEKPKPEQIKVNKNAESIFNSLMKQFELTPDQQLDEALPMLVDRLVHSTKTNGLIVLGKVGGTGKTTSVENQLQAMGLQKKTINDTDTNTEVPAENIPEIIDNESEEERLQLPSIDSIKQASQTLELDKTTYIYYRGAVTVPGMYNLLLQNRNKIIVIDDSDKLFLNKDGEGLLKAILEEGKERQLASVNARTTSKTSKSPKMFFFTGKIIFITNLTTEDIPQPVISRSFFIEINFTPEELLDRIKSKLPQLCKENPSVTTEIKNIVFQMSVMMLKQAKAKGKSIYIDFRTFAQGCEYATTRGTIWKEVYGRSVLEKNKHLFKE